MHKILALNVITVLVSLLLLGCNESNETSQCSVAQESINCNGGYSYWINDLAVASNGVLAISGVNDHKRASLQWVSFFSADLTTKLAELAFARNFYADEHNAPAILAINDGGWLIVRTGHNDTFENGNGKLYVYSVSEEFEIVDETQLFTESGASYAQLVQAHDNVYLLTRDTQKGWGTFTSSDNGKTWSQWQPLWQESGRRYMSLQNFTRDDLGNEQLLLNVGHHPIDVVQKIGYLLLSTSGLSVSSQINALVTPSGLSLSHEEAGNDVTLSLMQNNGARSNIRFLDAATKNDNICHLYSKLNNNWQLALVAHDLDNKQSYEFSLGSYQGVLNDSSYVLGASIGQCNLHAGELLDVFVAHQEQDSNDYIIEQVFIDVQSGAITAREEITRSKKQLYRPVYIEALNYLMFNEAEYWHSYDRWQATQKVIKLP